MRTRIVAAWMLALIATVAWAEPTPAERKLVETLEKVVPELAQVAQQRRDLQLAEQELELALEVAGESEVLSAELALIHAAIHRAVRSSSLKTFFPGDREGFLRGKIETTHHAVSLALAEAAASVEASSPERYTRYVKLLRRNYPSDEANEILGVFYYEPLRRWVSGADAEVLRAGGDYYNRRLLSPEEVAQLNRERSTWRNPWIIDDGVHQVRTTAPLRQANQILAFVGDFREFFLERFKDSWDLQPPKGLLPVIVTRTAKELSEQMDAATRARGLPRASGRVRDFGMAFYLHTQGALDPCLVTYEGRTPEGKPFPIPFDDFQQIRFPLAHELTHQLAFEYSKHNAKRAVLRHHYWVVEGIANFMCLYVYDGRRWTLSKRRSIPWGPSRAEMPFSWCSRNRDKIPPLERFMAQTRNAFFNIENYQISPTFCYFLLEGEGGKYRAGFCKLLQEIHQIRDRRKSFSDAFPGVELETLEAEFKRFMDAMKLE